MSIRPVGEGLRRPSPYRTVNSPYRTYMYYLMRTLVSKRR
jgi:hypothetical protein